MTEPATAGWDSDRPLTSPEQDIFEQAPFAKLMAKALQKHQGSDGIVIALHGPWGSGKSSPLSGSQACVKHPLKQVPQARAHQLPMLQEKPHAQTILPRAGVSR